MKYSTCGRDTSDSCDSLSSNSQLQKKIPFFSSVSVQLLRSVSQKKINYPKISHKNFDLTEVFPVEEAEEEEVEEKRSIFKHYTNIIDRNEVGL